MNKMLNAVNTNLLDFPHILHLTVLSFILTHLPNSAHFPQFTSATQQVQ